MDLGIKGRVALVTGGSRGLGRQCALSLAREGVNVGICARSEGPLQKAVEELKALGVKAVGVAADVTHPESARRIHQQVVDALGPVDILVNNVGRGRGAEELFDTTDDDFRVTMEENLYASLRLIRLVVPGMVQRKWGRIINIASIWGREYGGRVTYMPAKASLIALSKHLAVRLAKHGVLVNSVAPGSILFPGGGWESWINSHTKEEVEEFIKNNLPLGRFGWPEPVGDLVAFLASERAGLITGACINIDGGQSRSLI